MRSQNCLCRALVSTGGRDGLEALQADLCVFLVREEHGRDPFSAQTSFLWALSGARGAESGLLPPVLCLDAIGRAGNGGELRWL